MGCQTDNYKVFNMKQRAAELFADIAHSEIGQKRKYTHEPYIVHPRKVAYLVKVSGGTDDMISAAFLHDVLEDVAPINSLFSEQVILKQFGRKILDLVKWLTDISIPSDGNRERRKEIDRCHITRAPKEAKTIKIADLIDNSLTICEYDKDFAKIYLAEKELLLPELIDGNIHLWNLANNILINNKRLL